MQSIMKAMSQAMGELPSARFLDNQPEHRRDLVGQLLRDNRLFVEPRENRVDLLSNYPFSRSRLAGLCQQVGDYLDAAGGFAPLAEVLEHVQGTEYGASFLSTHLLGDLLRRHATFEIIPDGIIAQPRIGLAGWIAETARRALRAAPGPMTTEQIVLATPELGQFARSLRELLLRDPHVQSRDDMYYWVV